MVMTKNARQMLMGDIEMTPDIFLGSKDMRDKCISRIELLDKVKQIFLLPELECLTTKQMADYFEVGYEAIKSQYKKNQKEFDEDGVTTKSPSAFKILNGSSKTVKNMAQQNGKLVITLIDDTELIIPNRGIKCFPKRAILRMGMLLQGSRVSQEVRTQLLNTFEHATVEQRTAEINQEEDLVGSIIRAALNGDTENTVASFAEYVGYKNRYIAKIEQHNAELTQENAMISEQKKKVEKINKDLKTENNILATDVLKWTDRTSANRLIRVLAGCMHRKFPDTFNLVYHELLYKYSISLKNRAAKIKKKNLPLIAFVRDDEWIYVYKVVAAICNKCHINLNKLFKKAKIDVSNLDLTDKASTSV